MRKPIGFICSEHDKWQCQDCAKRRQEKREEAGFNVSAFKGHHNECLGEYVGGKDDIASATSKIYDRSEGRTTLEEVGQGERVAKDITQQRRRQTRSELEEGFRRGLHEVRKQAHARSLLD